MIAHLFREDGQEARFDLRNLTIPPCYLIRRGRLYALQPDYIIPPAGWAIVARYRECYGPNIDNWPPMNEAQISDAEASGVEIVNDGAVAEEAS